MAAAGRKSPVILQVSGIAAGKDLQKLRGIEQLHSLFPAAFGKICKVKQVLDGTHRGLRHVMLYRYYEREVVFAAVADYVKGAFHHIPLFQLLPVKAESDFLLPGEFFCQAFHSPVRGIHHPPRIQPGRNKNPKRALVLLAFLYAEFYFCTGKIQGIVLIIKVPLQNFIDYLLHLHVCSPALRLY